MPRHRLRRAGGHRGLSLGAHFPTAAPHRATLGFVQLPTDLTLDQEGPALLGRIPGVQWRLTKLAFEGADEDISVSTYTNAAGNVEAAARTFLPRRRGGQGEAAGAIPMPTCVDVVGMSCTSMSFVLGADHVWDALSRAQPEARAVTDMASSVARAAAALAPATSEEEKKTRVGLLTPYTDAVHAKNVDFLEAAGCDVVAAGNLGIPFDHEVSAVPLASIAAHAEAVVERAEMDLMIIGCSAFRACGPGFIDALEKRLGVHVVTSTQAILWDSLRLAGIHDTLDGYGELFRRSSGGGHDAGVRCPW